MTEGPSLHSRLLTTSGGILEVVDRSPSGDADGAVLYFHGGHESAVAAPASSVYLDLGYRVVTISRPGYGRTHVGRMSPAAFAPLVDEARTTLGIAEFAAVVGTSFGGPQAIEYCGRYPDRTRSLILHSAAPSSLPYPDRAAQRLLGPLVFHPALEGHVWHAVRSLLRRAPDTGLRLMVQALSTEPVATWLPLLDPADRRAIVETFGQMRSGSGFVADLSFAGPGYRVNRRLAQGRVACPTLITASRHDRGVAWAHAADLAGTIPRAHLVELQAPSHLFWIGSARAALVAAIRAWW